MRTNESVNSLYTLNVVLEPLPTHGPRQLTLDEMDYVAGGLGRGVHHWAGVALGVLGYGVWGATYGSIFGPVGTFIGGVAGTVVGGAIGGHAGDLTYEKFH